MGSQENHTNKAEPATNIGRRKATVFKIAAILAPLLLFFLVEAGLRLAGYGSDFPVFVETEGRPGYLVMNPDVSQKYFFSEANATSGYREYFKKKKGSGVYRIFVLGASTGVGYPYFTNGSFHRWLQYALNETFPEQKFEVINLSLTAINSYTLLDFTPALIEHKPDAVLIYAGHNEYYGALGVGSVNSLGRYPWLVNAVLKLRDLRIMQLATGAYLSLRTAFSSDSVEPETLMKRMVANQSIAYGSSTYAEGMDQFAYNMKALLTQLNRQDIPTFISTVVSNEKDVAPFVSDSTAEEKSAADYFREGRQAYQAGRYDDAKQAFVQAKERDMLRFRAPEAINTIIRTLADNFTSAHLVENKQRFDHASPHGIPGNELLTDHVHPDLQGYSLLAYGFYQSLKEENPFDLQWNDSLTLTDLRRGMPITVVDSLQGAYEVTMLKSGWPYYSQSELQNPQTVPEKIASALALKKMSWEQAMQQLFQYYQQNQDHEKALKVMRGFLLEHPENSEAYYDAAELAVQINDSLRATRFFAQAFDTQKSTTRARKIAARLIRNGYFRPAERYLAYIINHDPQDYVSRRLQKAINTVLGIPEATASTSRKVEKALQQAQIYQMVGEDHKAIQYVNRVLRLDPANAEAKSLARKINP